jgi:hypothetical protein
MKLRKRFIRKILLRIVFEFREGARNASYVINNP